MLQSEAGYINARPHLPDRGKPLATHGRTIHRVRTDKTQSEHNESSVHLLADIGANIGLCRDGPKPVIYRFYAGGCEISSRAFNGLLAICEGLRHLASKIDEELRDRTEPAFRPLRRLI